jgi:hypothetical protein
VQRGGAAEHARRRLRDRGTRARHQDYARAREYYHQALATAARSNDTPFILEILVGIARLLSLHAGHAKQARRLVTLVLENPASDHDTRSKATTLLTELERLLPGTAFELESEPPLPLDAAVASILNEGTTPLAGRDSR